MPEHDPSFYTVAEGKPHAHRIEEQEARLRRIVAASVGEASALRDALRSAGIAAEDLTLADLPRLPLLRKERLPAVQAEAPPFGGWLGRPREALRRVFVSPGPIYDPEGYEEDHWGLAPALHAAGFRSGDLVVNTFSYHFTPAGAMFDGALEVLRCITVPAGVGNLEIQVKTLLDLGARGFIGTPSFLAAVLAKLTDLGGRLPLEVAFVSGEPLSETLRAELESKGVQVSQGYAIGDLGLIAYECPARTGLHLADRVIVEVVDPTTGAPLPEGEAGEIAVTFLNDLYPLLRLATGDLSRLAPGSCPCGRTAPRLTRILGRVGDAVKVRGLFLHPHELDRAIAKHPQVGRFQAAVTRLLHQDELAIILEAETPDSKGLAEAVAQSVREATRLRAEVTVAPPGTLPADAKKMVDRRTWD